MTTANYSCVACQRGMPVTEHPPVRCRIHVLRGDDGAQVGWQCDAPGCGAHGHAPTFPATRCVFDVSGAQFVRDVRQAKVLAWAKACFGTVNISLAERARRLVEEAIELCQAEHVDEAQVHAIVRHVYGKPVGKATQEAAGVGVTLLAYCAAAGVSATRIEEEEVARITSYPPEYFAARQDKKADAGIAGYSEKD